MRENERERRERAPGRREGGGVPKFSVKAAGKGCLFIDTYLEHLASNLLFGLCL